MILDIYSFETFCDSWLRKARTYEMDSLSDYFDKFFTIYTVFNKVYDEATRFLLRTRRIPPPKNSRGEFAPMPDRVSATEYVVRFYGYSALQKEIMEDEQCRDAVDNIVNLIESGRFYFYEDYKTGSPDTVRDLKLANEASKYKPQAILALIYQARCNLFHGTKQYHEVQRVLLHNLIMILEFITVRVFEKLRLELRSHPM